MKHIPKLILKESLFALTLAVVILTPMGGVHKTTREDTPARATTFANDFMAGNYLAARFAEKHLLPEDAVTHYLAALGKDTTNTNLLERSYRLLAFTGAFDRAAALAERRVTEQTDDRVAFARVVAALAPIMKGDFAQARRWLENSGGHAHPSPKTLEDAALLPMLAWLHALEDSPEKAAALLALLPQNPQHGFRDFQHVLMQFAAGNKDAALAALAAMDFSNQPHRIVDMAGWLYRHYGMEEQAQTLAQTFTQKEPGYGYQTPALALASTPEAIARLGMAEALFEAGAQAFRNKTEKDAVSFLRMALMLHPTFDDARLLLAHTLEQLNLNDEALATYRSIPMESRFYWQGQLAVAAVLNRVGSGDEARQMLQGIASERQSDHSALLLLGDILLSDNKFDEAAATYSAALARIGKAETNDWPVYYARGISYEQAGLWEKAEPDFLKALELSPDQPSVLNYLGYSWLMLDKNVEKAEEMLRVAVSKQPGDAHIIDSYGWALYKLGMYNEALIFLERATMLLPNDPTTNDHLGDVYWRLGRHKEARFQWKKAMAFNPAPKDLAAIQLKLEQGLGTAPPLASAD